MTALVLAFFEIRSGVPFWQGALASLLLLGVLVAAVFVLALVDAGDGREDGW